MSPETQTIGTPAVEILASEATKDAMQAAIRGGPRLVVDDPEPKGEYQAGKYPAQPWPKWTRTYYRRPGWHSSKGCVGVVVRAKKTA